MALTAAVALLVTAALAAGQAPPTVDGVATPDTMHTPVAKSPRGLWTQVAGDVFPGADAGGYSASASPTAATADLFAVRFSGERNGLAGGAECRDPATPRDRLATCERVPVLYRYTREVGRPGAWEKVDLPGDDRPGYIAALAWVGRDKAIAVGGDTSPSADCPACGYPRREPARTSPLQSDDDYAAHDPAGRARVWVYEQGAWCELGPGSACGTIPDLDGAPAGAMTALDCSPRRDEGELCVAGGLRQLWIWRDGRFVKGDSDRSPDPVAGPVTDDSRAGVTGASALRFRVRSLRFVLGEATVALHAIGVTSGCCSGAPVTDIAQEVLLQDDVKGVPRWEVRTPMSGPASSPGMQHRSSLPDSYYALAPSTVHTGEFSIVAAPGGPPDANEPDARLLGPFPGGAYFPGVSEAFEISGEYAARADDIPHEAATLTLGRIRLVAGDGDLGAPLRRNAIGQSNHVQGPASEPDGSPDGMMDWAVGAVDSGDQQGRAIAYTTLAEPPGAIPVTPLACPKEPSPYGAGVQALASCQASPDAAQDALVSKALYALSSYTLNAYTMVGTTGQGWAVGDRGAIECLGCGAGGSTGIGAPPAPPTVAPHAEQTLPDASAYDAFRPLGRAEPGAVPPLAAQPVDRLAAPEAFQTGSPDTTTSAQEPRTSVSQVVMSRDGTEGWAIGSPLNGAGAAATTLYHFNGAVWTGCDADGLPGVVAPDPACAELAPLMHARDSTKRLSPVKFVAAARVPLETDDDPTNDDEFEVVALGTGYIDPSDHISRMVVARYRHSRWSVDRDAMQAFSHAPFEFTFGDIAFATADDGWVTSFVSGAGKAQFAHFDGSTWHVCTAGDAACGDLGKRLPFEDGQRLQLAVAGSRVYLYGARTAGTATTDSLGTGRLPLILYRDHGACVAADDPGCWKARDGGEDPKTDAASGALPARGEIYALSVARNADGAYVGWAVRSYSSVAPSVDSLAPDFHAAMEHLAPGSDRWTAWPVADASTEYPLATNLPRLLTFSGASGEQRAIFAGADPEWAFSKGRGPLLEFDPRAGRWEAMRTPFVTSTAYAHWRNGEFATPQTLAPDGRGGAWIVVRRVEPSQISQETRQGSSWFYRYSDRRPRPVFTDAAHPVRETVTDASGGGDGSLWLTTTTSAVYRYDRLTGWDRMVLPGWDAGRLVTNPTGATAVAVGADGRGIIVGPGGRIADVGPARAVLDPAAGVACAEVPVAPCGTTRTLRAAAVAPDGSALVGGDALAILWQPAGEGFRAVTRPPDSVTARITGISMPQPDRAWVSTSSGQVFAGRLDASGWAWRPEAIDEHGDALALRPNGSEQAYPLNAVAVDPAGHGYAVGNHGILLERDAGSGRWRRHPSDEGPRSDFDVVALPADGSGRGALIGGENGLILTLVNGHFEVADPGDPWTGARASDIDLRSARIRGLALLPGSHDGEVEAWAAIQAPTSSATSPPPMQLLHYASDAGDRLLDPAGRVAPLADSPDPRPGELTFAAFGKQDCSYAPKSTSGTCPEQVGSNQFHDLVGQRVVERIAKAARRPGGPAFALFTGDANDAAGREVDELELFGGFVPHSLMTDSPVNASLVHERWAHAIADPLARAGVPLFGAIGGQDLSRTPASDVGTNLPWRQALAGMPSPWGRGAAASGGDGLTFRPVAGTADPTDGGARTHYAFDVVAGDRPLARVVVVDTSLRSLATSEATQQPLESQTAWLAQVLDRPAGEQLVVLSNSPTYSYGPGQDQVEQDASQFEALLFAHGANAVVSGRVGWNGVYWATAPGVHEPCPGGDYQTAVPEPGTRQCGVAAGQQTPNAAARVSGALQTLGAPPAPADDPTGTVGRIAGSVVPFVIASSAGGKFAADATDTSASKGFWHGYTIVRLSADGDPAKTIIEQRPVFDWVGLRSGVHAARPGQRFTLRGYGREPVGTDAPIRYDDINAPTITHRYDLLEADPQRPWLPRVVEGNGNPHGYVPLDASIATVDRSSGTVIAQRSNHPRVYAIALLSVGDQAATTPIVFEPRRSYTPPRQQLLSVPQVPPVRVLSFTASSLAPPTSAPPASTPPPISTSLSLPAPPALPSFPGATPTAAAPPAPPPPPPPPGGQQSVPIDLNLNAVGVLVPPTPGVTAQPTPPVQPSPPSGARREAKQRQAATAKSEEGAADKASDATGDLAQGPMPPTAAQMTRRDRERARAGSLTAVAHAGQPSAWVLGLEWGGGIGLMALALALGFTGVRPTPRRRPPVAPAPAWARRRR